MRLDSEDQVEYLKYIGAVSLKMALQLVKLANGVTMTRHWKTNQVVSVDTFANVPDSRHQTARFHRGHIHAALAKHVPKEWIHLNKKISRAESNNDGVVLHFEDGSSAYGDILIGADGIRSVSCCVQSIFNWETLTLAPASQSFFLP